MGRGGSTSHTVILARLFNIPTLMGVDVDGACRIHRLVSY
nr:MULTISPECIES: PEP-utilizing enzyme [Yersinia pseudotuberculosis complex]